ncbi:MULTISPECIES: 3-oxoacyl-[acyl-carrier-protein] synthase III C-terminal domain-containing protein [Paenibacillus]|uniref:3-oxoacyl-[acyl-carrier-protein] synthase III C-terminal domain-containing protein n=1 Tax=Paenibacillus TaxID=44249 RepID=UPI00038F6949|nr:MULTISPECIES: 3-oxoacyl-[acyl-carrier-protein] synthase III C-terminal domain-containing protein [Paenibacillus]CDN42553.1 Beta-ketoacyl-acyl-carrier-protein synthase III [Paenibacillus sp. P22]
MTAVRIRSLEIYHPSHEVDNEYYIERFRQSGVEVSGLLKALGREKRFVIDSPEENTYTMALEASRKALAAAGLAAEDLDLIIFSSQTPEYLLPSNALKLHSGLGGSKQTMCYDINANCAGMLVAVEQASRTMLSNPRIKRALVVGADHFSVHSPQEPVYHSNFADSAAAVILESQEGSGGFIDSLYQTDTAVIDNSLFPANGLSNLYRGDAAEAQVRFTPFDDSVCVDSAVDSLRELMESNGIRDVEVGAYLFSQFSVGNVKLVSERLGIDGSKVAYVGDKYGYTASNSPFLALHDALRDGKIKRGDYLVFWTVGAGWQNVSMLMEY